MNRTAKIWLIIAGVLVVLGPILIVCAATIGGGFHFDKVEYNTEISEIGSTFDQIAVKTDVSDFEIATADEKECRMECSAPEKVQYTAQVENGTLVIRSSDQRTWRDQIFSFNAKAPKIKLYLPQSTYASLTFESHTGDAVIPAGFTFDELTVISDASDIKCSAAVTGDLKIKLSTGDLNLQNMKAGSAELETTTGDVEIGSMTTEGNLLVSTTTGDITLSDTIAEKSFVINSTTGDVSFERCDAVDLIVKTTTGDVEGTLLSDKVFVTDTSTGDIHVPNTSAGGKCEITTSTGDIQIEIRSK